MDQDTHTPTYSVEGIILLSQNAERALFVPGGDLELFKFFWYLIQWIWDRNNIPYMASSEECPGILSITQGTDTDSPIMIQRLEPSELHARFTPQSNGNPRDSKARAPEKVRQFSAAATHKSLDRVDAHTMCKIFFTPVLHYPLSVSNIPNKELKSMQKNLLKTFKRRMKFRSNLTDSIMLGTR
jgi:hypothetical protein